MKKYFVLSISSILVLLFYPLQAHAQSTTLSINPPVVEILLAPGKKVTQTFNFQATGDDLALTPEIHLVKPSDDYGHVTIDPNPINPNTLPLTITSSIPLGIPYTLSSPNIPITISMEATNVDKEQDIYLALVLKTTNDTPFARQSLGVGGGISSLILVTIAPSDGLPINLEIKNFMPPVIHDSWSALTLSPTVQNHTDTMIRPGGTYEITSPAGKSVFKLDLYPNLILGNGSRSIMGSSDSPRGYPDNLNQTPGATSNLIPLTWSPSWYDIGPYHLHLTLTSEAGTKITEVEKTVWIFPLRIGVLLFLIAMVICTTLLKTHTKKVTIDTRSKD